MRCKRHFDYSSWGTTGVEESNELKQGQSDPLGITESNRGNRHGKSSVHRRPISALILALKKHIPFHCTVSLFALLCNK